MEREDSRAMKLRFLLEVSSVESHALRHAVSPRREKAGIRITQPLNSYLLFQPVS